MGIDGHKWVGAIYTGAHRIGLAELSDLQKVTVSEVEELTEKVKQDIIFQVSKQ